MSAYWQALWALHFRFESAEEEVYRYANIREKTKQLFDVKVIDRNDIQLTTTVRQNLESTLETRNYFWLMRKIDVDAVISQVTQAYGYDFTCETDFIELIKLVNKSTWMNQWDFINKI